MQKTPAKLSITPDDVKHNPGLFFGLARHAPYEDLCALHEILEDAARENPRVAKALDCVASYCHERLDREYQEL